MKQIFNFYRLLNILSIDVALGAVCCGAWFAKYFDVRLRPYALIALGLTVWIIYTADHLLDARKVKNEASTLRHRFHQTYFKVLVTFLVLASALDFVLLFFIRPQVLHAGVVLICIVAVYLLVNRWISYLKEIAVAVLYCGGVMLPALSLETSGISIHHGIVILCFFLTALINVLMFSWFDYESDLRDGNNSFPVKFGKAFTRKFIITLFALQFMLLLALSFGGDVRTLLLFVFMNGMLCLIFSASSGFNRMEYYRLAGDAVFLIPAAFLLI